MVRRKRPRPAVAADARPVRDPRLGGDAPADAGLACRAAVGGVARALADGGGAGGSVAGGRDPRVAGARVQPARAEPLAGGLRRRRARVARRPDRAPRRRPVHRGGGRELRVRPAGAAGGREHRPGARADGRRRSGRTRRRRSSTSARPCAWRACRAAASARWPWSARRAGGRTSPPASRGRSRARSGSGGRRCSGSSPSRRSRPTSTRRRRSRSRATGLFASIRPRLAAGVKRCQAEA